MFAQTPARGTWAFTAVPSLLITLFTLVMLSLALEGEGKREGRREGGKAGGAEGGQERRRERGREG